MDDPRLTPARPEIAAKYLEGKVKAARFVAGEVFEVVEPIAPLREQPAADAMVSTQALLGERITVYDRNDEGWAWGQLSNDGYVGWLADRALAKPAAGPTHQVIALRTLAFPGPSIKLPPVAAHAKSENDPLWRLPLWPAYDSWLDSKVADINNAPSGGFAGSIICALFLQRFVTDATRWLHVDIYGWTPSAKPARPEGGECQAARAIYKLLSERYG